MWIINHATLIMDKYIKPCCVGSSLLSTAIGNMQINPAIQMKAIDL
jgi:hypothetical protein